MAFVYVYIPYLHWSLSSSATQALCAFYEASQSLSPLQLSHVFEQVKKFDFVVFVFDYDSPKIAQSLRAGM